VRSNTTRFQGDNLRHNLLLVEELRAHAQAENSTPAQLALAWLLAQSRSSCRFPARATSAASKGKRRGRGAFPFRRCFSIRSSIGTPR
jgi:aryl-alcohol dehydrogenase-like predicted oxidoreductase